MSSWDQCCMGGKFNANVKTQRTTETVKKIERLNENEKQAFTETSDKIHFSNFYAVRKDEDYANVNNAAKAEFQLSFSELGLNCNLLKWIESLGFSEPNKVQNTVLYQLSERNYRHSIITAPKKSGKTSAALMWVFNEILCHKSEEYPKALMICPTIEVADATYRLVEQVVKYCNIKICVAKKGKKLNKGERVTDDLVIATPDKAVELSISAFNLKKVRYLIFDEAHRMSSAEGHLKTLDQVCSQLSCKCSIILCTLFCNKVLNKFIDERLIQNLRIEIENDILKMAPEEIFIVHSNNEERVQAFMCLEKSNLFSGQSVVFCKTKDESNRLKSILDNENFSVQILSGDLKPLQRSDLLQRFKENNIKLLITTYSFMEVLEAENVTKVINYDQVLNNDYKLDPDIYEQIEHFLNGRKHCLIGSFIEEKWQDVLIQQQPGSAGRQVYPKAQTISAKELINGQYCNK